MNRTERELETEIKNEKARLERAARDAADQLRYFVSEKGMRRDYPVETAIALMLGGFLVARWVQDRRRRLT